MDTNHGLDWTLHISADELPLGLGTFLFEILQMRVKTSGMMRSNVVGNVIFHFLEFRCEWTEVKCEMINYFVEMSK